MNPNEVILEDDDVDESPYRNAFPSLRREEDEDEEEGVEDEPPPPAPKPKAKRKKATPKRRNAADFASERTKSTCSVTRLKPGRDRHGLAVGTGYCGQVSSEPSQLKAEIEELFGGGVYRVEGYDSEGEHVPWTEEVPGEPKPIGAYVAEHERLRLQQLRQEEEEVEVHPHMRTPPPYGAPSAFFGYAGQSHYDPHAPNHYERAKAAEQERDRALRELDTERANAKAAVVQAERDAERALHSALERQREKHENELERLKDNHRNEVVRLQDKLEAAEKRHDEAERRNAEERLRRESDAKLQEIKLRFQSDASKPDPLATLLPVLLKSSDQRSESDRNMLTALLANKQEGGMKETVALIAALKDVLSPPPDEPDEPSVQIVKQGAGMVTNLVEAWKVDADARQRIALLQAAQSQGAVPQQQAAQAAAPPPQLNPAQAVVPEESSVPDQLKPLYLLEKILGEQKAGNSPSYAAEATARYAAGIQAGPQLRLVCAEDPVKIAQSMRAAEAKASLVGKGDMVRAAYTMLESDEGVKWWVAFATAVLKQPVVQ